MIIFLPIVYVEAPPPYVNEWETDIYKDVGAADENPWIAEAWDYMDPEPTTTTLNPEFYYHAPEFFEIKYINFYLIEDGTYHWFGGNVGEEPVCFFGGDLCYSQGPDWFLLSSSWDIDIIIIKLDPLCSTCYPSKPPTP